MGQGIAAHLANVGIPSYLFDIVPGEPSPDEAAQGLTLADQKVRNRLALAGLASMSKARPPLLYRKELAGLVNPCNFDDDATKLAECDWIVEAVVERLDIKQKVFTMVDGHRRPGSIVSSNTSGLSVESMAQGRSDDFRRHFMVTHFFNPVRYMRLLEMVPCDDTDRIMFRAMAEFGEHVLGKGIVYAKDTPNFIGNRIGTFGMTSVFHWMKELGLGVTEVDKIFGPAMGRPKSAVFRTADVVGLDTMAHVLTTVAESCPDDPWRSRFEVPAPMQELITRGSLGEKSGAGFYKKTRDEAGERKILALDLDSLDYEEQTDVRFDSIGVARARARAGDKVEAMVWYDDEAGRMAWKVTAEICSYAAELLGEIADDVVNVDRALRWGFNYEMGPFQTWDAVGVERSVQRMRDEGMKIPPVVDTMVAESEGTWYVKRDGLVHYWDVEKEDYLPVPVPERHISIQLLADRGKQLDGNNGATIYNLGDGVGLVEFHTKMNSIDNQIVEVIERACDLVNEGELAGLVVGNEAPNFSVGANIGLLGMLATAGMWDELDRAVAAGQNANMKMKYCRGPVVAAPRGMTLGGGCEVTLHSDAVRAAAGRRNLLRTGRGGRRSHPGRRRMQGTRLPLLRQHPARGGAEPVRLHREDLPHDRHGHDEQQCRGGARLRLPPSPRPRHDQPGRTARGRQDRRAGAGPDGLPTSNADHGTRSGERRNRLAQGGNPWHAWRRLHLRLRPAPGQPPGLRDLWGGCAGRNRAHRTGLPRPREGGLRRAVPRGEDPGTNPTHAADR
jgi:3-hydroxyacyl-CoA dehydrogenase